MADVVSINSHGTSLPGSYLQAGQAPATAHNVIPFPGRRADDGQGFARLWHAAMIARAERDLIEVRWRASYALSLAEPFTPPWPEREAAFQAMLKAVKAVAQAPARTRAEIARKKRAIGKVWLRAEGELYDWFRACIARDEATIARRAA